MDPTLLPLACGHKGKKYAGGARCGGSAATRVTVELRGRLTCS
ncbi:MAG TPA: hypothetical protein VFJ22_06150 [Dermatophilaceae bacterium]|nr:hypothetical protein [Dermatophilaceae bacterium]